LLPAILERIDREAVHARAGRPASIAIKVNGLSDPDVISALYAASEAGVEIDLIVRGICTLRPGVPDLSSRIRVVSVVGRFLEHSRIYRFANDGTPEYLIGSSDLRPRNLRRRVELLVPVLDAGHRARLDELLQLYRDDQTGWELGPDGNYTQRTGTSGAQDRLLAQTFSETSRS
jgi:polyphosphate kinase